MCSHWVHLNEWQFVATAIVNVYGACVHDHTVLYSIAFNTENGVQDMIVMHT